MHERDELQHEMNEICKQHTVEIERVRQDAIHGIHKQHTVEMERVRQECAMRQEDVVSRLKKKYILTLKGLRDDIAESKHRSFERLEVEWKRRKEQFELEWRERNALG